MAQWRLQYIGENTMILLFLLAMTVSQSAGDSADCLPRSFGQSSVVCECNSTYCDSPGVLSLPSKGQYLSFLSSRAGARLQPGSGTLRNSSTGAALVLSINPAQKYQRIKGFGGAMTDAAAINILSLSRATQDQLLGAYFSKEGIQYTVVRVPMASCDFSTREYTYADTPDDFELRKFSLAKEDTEMKIPLLQRAQALSPQPLSLFASPWSAPAWMKTNGDLNGKGTLKGEPGNKYHKTWAQYYTRFLDEYRRYNLSFWAVTAENEPTAGLLANYSFQSLGFTAERQRDFIARDLGPALARSAHPATQLLILDDNRLLLPYWAKVVLSDLQAARYVHGIAVHWYLDGLVPADLSLGTTHRLFPEYYLFGSEACVGSMPWDRGVWLGSWERGEQYSHDIMQDLNHYVTGWTDWNLALDQGGGPNWVKNFVDSSVIVDASRDVFYKQPTFYSIAHFSKFLDAGSQRVGVSSSHDSALEVTAFIRPDAVATLIVLNRSEEDLQFEVQDVGVGVIPAVSPAHSIMTLLWPRE
ncbi:lysosomal acid glucosylceramidase isoform X2 [Lepisosteus oculatus]|uniref:lysosomal acid glucosylceramidase isoform X2 n=1 Tax=Lepisosteus oculatus TaxID=7918 RepID=UPI0037144D5D